MATFGTLPHQGNEAAQTAASKLKEVHAKHGGDAIGFIGSNRTSNEENYMLQKLARETFDQLGAEARLAVPTVGLNASSVVADR